MFGKTCIRCSKTFHAMFYTLLRATNEGVLRQNTRTEAKWMDRNGREPARRKSTSSSSSSSSPRVQWHLQQLLPRAHVVSTASMDIESHFRIVSPDDWTQKITVFKRFNFTDDDCYHLIINYPMVFDTSYPVHHIENVINEWRQCKLEFSLIQKILIKQPIFLTLDAQEVQKRISLFQVFCKSNKSLAKFLVNCPNVMADDWESVMEKMEYLLRVKRVPKSEIFFSHVLTQPLDFIKLRFELLEKCGVYKVQIVYPHKEYKFKKKAHTNPKLFKIIDTDDNAFSFQVAGITDEEYIVFSEFFQSSNTVTDLSDADE